MKTQTIDYETYIKESKIDDFVEYLFSSEKIFETQTIDVTIKGGKNVIFKEDKKKELEDKLKKIKKYKDFKMDDGDLGESLYIRILKDGKVHIIVRISYHRPEEDFGTGKNDKNAIGYLCIDALNIEDQNKVLKIRKDFNTHQNEGIPKEEHKKRVNELELPNSKYIDLGTEDSSKIIDTIKTFLKSKNLNLYENLNYENFKDFSISCEINWDD